MYSQKVKEINFLLLHLLLINLGLPIFFKEEYMFIVGERSITQILGKPTTLGNGKAPPHRK